MAARYSVQASRARQLLQWDEAKALYSKAIKFDPKNWEPYLEISKIYLAQAEWMSRSRVQDRETLLNGAVTNCTRALELNPLQSEVMLNLARAYEQLKQNDQTLLVYERALKVDPNNAQTFAYLGRFYRHIGDEAKALEAFTHSHDLDCSWSNIMSPMNIEDIKNRK
jgi:tetratricopeptide (TPR) repeat protein